MLAQREQTSSRGAASGAALQPELIRLGGGVPCLHRPADAANTEPQFFTTVHSQEHTGPQPLVL